MASASANGSNLCADVGVAFRASLSAVLELWPCGSPAGGDARGAALDGEVPSNKLVPRLLGDPAGGGERCGLCDASTVASDV